METKQKRCLIIKEELEWTAEDSHAPDLANQEMAVNMDSLEEDFSCIDGEARVVQHFTPVPQTVEFIKTELILDEEFRDEMTDSERTCKQNILAQARDLDSNLGSATQTNHQHMLAPSHGQAARGGISDNESESSETSSHSNSSRKELRKTQESFACELCQRTYRDRYTLRNHLSTHATNRKREITCDLCERKFYYKRSLNRHQKLYCSKNIVSSFICEVCGSPFARKGNLKVHMLTEHLDQSQTITTAPQTAEEHSINTIQILKDRHAEGKRFECKICSQFFKTKITLKRHLRTHSKDRKRDFACDLCERKFYTKHLLWCHKKRHTPGTYHCKGCGKSYKYERSLKLHSLRCQYFDDTQQITPQPLNDADLPMKTELTSDEEEDFIDEGSDRDSVSHTAGSQQPALVTEDEQCTRVGIAANSVSCEVCHNSYPAEIMGTHMRFAHGNKTYKCQFCLQVYKNKKLLKTHISTQHEINLPRPYACEHCGFTFLSKGYLKWHMITHHWKNGKLGFNCELCEKKFASKHGLNYHLKTHNRTAVSCEVCGKSFLRKEGLRNHMMRKHTAKTQPLTPDPQIVNCDSVHTKEELISDEEFLEETNSSLAQPLTPEAQTANDESTHTKPEHRPQTIAGRTHDVRIKIEHKIEQLRSLNKNLRLLMRANNERMDRRLAGILDQLKTLRGIALETNSQLSGQANESIIRKLSGKKYESYPATQLPPQAHRRI